MERKFDTLADLVREGASVLFRCGGCDKHASMSPYRLAGVVWSPEALPDLEGREVAPLVARLKCAACGSRVAEWWPMCPPPDLRQT